MKFNYAVNKKDAPRKMLICHCCGYKTKGRQWWNRDKGYGVCPECANFIAGKEGLKELMMSCGIPGVHFVM